jgi:hypothetical protein
MTSPKVSEEIQRELNAEAERAAFAASAAGRASPKCPECGAMGSLEERDGKLVCIDCDADVLASAKLSGFGRR